MDLPVMPPVQPMLAKSVARIPDPDQHPGGLSFEPKWDGFRCVLFKDGDEVELTSRNTKPLTRYFPDLVEAARAQLPARCVLDGEIFVAVTPEDPAATPRLHFELLSERIHPAASRVEKLARETPAGFVAFDLLALGDDALLDVAFGERRRRLAAALAGLDTPDAPDSPDSAGRLTGCHLVRTTTDPVEAQRWFEQFEGAGLDGVIAKPLDAAYVQGGRAMFKIKHARTADVVLAGLREHKTSTAEQPLLGSLLLGLYDDDGNLQHIGVAASFTQARRAELMTELAPLVCEIADHPWGAWQEWAIASPDRVPGTQSRWSAGKDLSFTPLRPERVLEVGYDHMEGRRFRHTAQFKRWRPDRDPASCGYAQLDEPVSYDLSAVLSPDPAEDR